MNDTGDTEHNGDGSEEHSAEIPPQNNCTATPSEREIAEHDNKYAKDNRERLIYRPFRRFILCPLGRFAHKLDSYGVAVTAAATFAIAVLTGFLAWYANGQGKILDQQIADSRASQRAFIYPQIPPVQSPSIVPGNIRLTAIWINSGNTPTKNLVTYVACPSTKGPSFVFDPFTLDNRGSVRRENRFIAPKQPFQAGSCEITNAEVDQSTRHQIALYFVSWVTYYDVFSSEKHTTEACLDLQLNFALNSPVGGGGLTYCAGGHNCADDGCERENRARQ